ncbi:MAG: HlyD family type I secretion periplasmic adaptor subunit [Bosea sp.]|uniref:HlyD family type I secretion periplasmic adaptor subunit n=2 Tax=Bosea TaxID=85413 RepID=UPI00095F4426|nr:MULTISPECIES: HlyD family type I secretion periplasmic adaptor subunit [unclassified Bosea (in: a-proteobacteria)]MBN9455338.1 HlyD family type I secretion periplasmic adaptor subunit [Bosea sp. (in: a-proteobacteria)]OJV04954.1 MAG: hemolysin secretion protein D [Bosea sp. 67-29]
MTGRSLIRGPERSLVAAPLQDESDERTPSLRSLVLAGIAAIGVGFGGFGAWAVTARLDNAAVASGIVAVDSKRKTVSHLEGGILKSLLKAEGERVVRGEPLLRLEDARARAELQQLQAKRVGLMAKLARLRAEQSKAAEVDFPDDIETADTPVTREVLRAERTLFKSRAQVHEGKIQIQQRVIEQYQAEAAALKAQIDATDRQRSLIDEEVRILTELYEKRYAKRSQLVELQTKQSELVGRAGEYAARKAKAEQAVAGANLEILSISLDRQNEIAGDIQESQLMLSEVTERIVQAEDVLRRLVVKAPQEGIVSNIRMRTAGSVIAAGEAILDIVPENEPLVIEAKVDPRDIDAVRVGAATRVRLTAFNSRLLPPLEAKVTYVAPDQLVDDKTGFPYFVVRAEIDPGSLKDHKVALHAGMTAEVMIVNGARRAIDYLISPFTDSFNRAFRED